MQKNNIEAIYALSPVQQGILFHSLYAPQSGVYVLQMSGALRGKVNPEAFEHAWQQVVDRHPILRTGFAWKGKSTAHQVTLKQVKLPVTHDDWRGLSAQEQEQQLEEYLNTDRERGFDLAKAPLMRLSLFRLADDLYQYCWTSHHLLLDGWSMPIIFKEASAFYEAFTRGTELQLKQPRPYRDYIAWLQSQDLSAAEAYWRRTLKGFTAPTPLGIDSTAYSELLKVDDYAQQQLQLSTELSSALQQVSREKQVTLNTLMQGAWAVLLSRYSGEREVLFGTTVSGRPAQLPGVEQMVGPFINTLPVRVKVNGEQPVLKWLKELQAGQAEMRQYEHSPLVEVQGWSEMPRGVPLFESILVFENYPEDAPAKRNNKKSDTRLVQTTNYPLCLIVEASARGTIIHALYDAQRFAEAAIHRLLDHLKMILQSVVADPQQLLLQLPRLTAAELQSLHSFWLDSERSFPSHLCAHQLFEQQVERTPDAVALIYEAEQLTYAELNARANRFAHHLRSLGVGPETPVGILLPRSTGMVVAVLAVLKAGGAYVPLDPAYPQERLAFVLQDAGVEVLLTETELLERIPVATASVLCLDTLADTLQEACDSNPNAPVCADNLAYVIYTSGSTGVPKGVAIAHRSCAIFLHWVREAFTAEELRCVLASTSLCFDLSVFELLGPLSWGGAVMLAENALQLPYLARRNEVSLINTVPSAIAELVRMEGVAEGVRVVNLAGEALTQKVTDAVFGVGSVERVVNLYGPTEDTTYTTMWEARRGEEVKIGRGIAKERLYILDEGQELVACGVTGEIYIGGDGLARGYWERPELTAERFVPDPFSANGGARMYRTGDIGRWTASGELEYVGRADNQVKVRGYRIELGEIESVLSTHEAVRECVVVAREDDGDTRLVGYVVAESEVSREALRAYLKERLPEYMVPVIFVMLDQLPLTANGKVDRKALPAPEQQRPELEHSFVAPRSKTEELLARIWSEVLRLEQVGVNDNFFELGGDSILSIQIIARANKAGLQLTPRDLFLHPTVAALAQVADSRTSSESTAIAEQGVVTGSVPFTPIQRWFFEDQRLPQPHHFNQSVLLEVPAEVDAALLSQVLKKLVVHHDALRLRFTQTATGWQQQYVEIESAEFFSFHDLSAVAESERANALEAEGNRLQGSLNLEAGPVLRAALFRYSADEAQRLLLVIHHLVVDGVSWRILLEDLQRGYEQAASGEQIELGAKTSSFKQWAEQLKEYAQTSAVRDQLSYWSAAVSEGVASLPRDYTGGANTIASTRSINLKLDQEQTRALLQEVPGVYHTQINDVLLTALGRVLSEWSNSERVVVELEGHGREEIGGGVDVTRTVGWFTTLYPVVLEITPDVGIGAVLKSVKEQLRHVPEKGIGYGLLRYMDQDGAQLQGLQPEVSFNYLGQFGSGLSAEKGWRAARESGGEVVSREGKRAHLLEVEARVAGGRLWVEWNYSTEEHVEETIRSLGERYLEVLEELIEHCRSDEAGGYTPSDFPLAQVTQEQLEVIERNYPQLEQLYPLSPVQEGILFHSLYAPDSGAYMLQTVGRLSEAAEVEKFIEAWQEVVARHEVLRASFIWEGVERAHQVVQHGVKLDVQREDWRGETREAQERRLEEYVKQQRERGFDFRRGPLMRVAVIQLTDHEYAYCWMSHHLLIDGWSAPLIFKEASTIHEALCRETSIHLAQPRPFSKYIGWLQSQDLSGAEAYWRRTLKGFTATTPLGIDSGSHSELLNVDDYAQQKIELSTELSSALQRMGREKQVTLSTLMQGAWAVLLSRYSGEREVLFGSTVSGRPAQLEGIEQMVGPFINTLPVRVKLSDEQPVLEWLKQLQAEQAEMRQYEHSPLVEVQGWSDMPRGVPLFESLLVMESYPVEVVLEKQFVPTRATATSIVETTNYPLTIEITPGRKTLLQVIYDKRRLGEAAMRRLLGHLETVLFDIAGNPEKHLADLTYLTEAEHHHLIVESAGTQIEFPDGPCVHQLFESQADRTPDYVAVADDEQKLTYRQLNERANSIASVLVQRGIGPDKVVSLLSPRTIDLLAAIIGVFKAGGAYLPLDPLNSPQRLRQVLTESRTPLVLVSRDLATALEEALEGLAERPGVLVIDELTAQESLANPDIEISFNNLAYVIYTSGSTGVPKGAMVEHGGMLNHLLAKVEDLSLSAADRVAQTASQCFDISVWQYLAVLLVGGTVEIVGDETAHDPRQLLTAVRERGISVLETVPSLLREMLRTEEAELEMLRWLVVTGEALPAALVREWRAQHAAVQVMNAYGPTECSDDVTHAVVEELSEQEQWVVIGRAVRNTRLYVLDEQMRVVPVGVKAELYVGGDGVGRGYLGRADLTAERFVPDAYSSMGGERLYRTGDEVRWRESGELEFIGRVDQQVKVRGYRIELGEIESVLSQHEAVRECVVVVREEAEGEKQLVAYVVAETEVSREALRAFLKERLPEYMAPAAFVLLEQLPLTANGKVDRKALPAPEPQRAEHLFVAPGTETEELLARIWSQVLRLAQVGINDNFFELGGDSILSIQIVARANQAGLQLVPRDLFVQPTVAGLAQLAESRSGSESIALAEQGVVTGSVPLTPVQQWFFEQRLAQPHHFNQSVLLEVPAEVDVALLSQVLKKLVLQHDALRMRFTYTASGWQQQYAESESAEFFSFHDLSAIEESERVTVLEAEADQLQRSLNLEAGPLLRAALFRYSADEAQRLLLVIHHLVVDGVSWRILLEDVQRGYEQAARGEVIELGAKTSSFKQWAEQLKDYAQTAAVREQLGYWSAAGSEGVARLPRDYSGGANAIASTRSINLKLDQEQTRALLQEVPGVYHTQINDVLLTALGRVLGEWSGGERVVVELEGHGREEIGGGVDVTRTVGWFTTLYPVVLEAQRETGIGATLKFVKEQLRGVPEKGIGYGLLRYMDQGEAQLPELQPEVSFNYLGQFGEAAAEEKGWRPAQESSGQDANGDGERELLLEVNAGVGDGQLQVQWTYSTEVHADETIRRLGERYIEVLEDLIEHCRSAEAGGYTPSDFPLAQVTQDQLEVIERNYPQLDQLYQLSPVQEGILFHSLYAPDSGAYVLQTVGRLPGAMEEDNFIAAWQAVIERHEVLRASFIWEGVERAHQVVEHGVKLEVAKEDWRGEARADQERKLEEYVKQERERGFDFNHGPLMRMALFRFSDNYYHYCWTIHHLLIDGWSAPLIFNEASTIYEALCRKKTIQLAPPQPFSKYIGWLQSQDLSAAEAYWRRTLKGFTTTTSLGIDSGSHPELLSVDDYAQQQLTLSTELSGALQRMSREKQVTLNTLVQGAWAVLLSRYSGEREVLFGTTVSGRPAQLEGIEQMVGPLMNTLPVRIKVAEAELAEGWLRQLQAEQAEMRQYEHSPLVEVQGWSEMPRGVSLFESILVFENYPNDVSPQLTIGEAADDETRLIESSNYPLTVVITPGQNISLDVLYNNQRFDRAAIKRMLGHLEMLLGGLVSGADQPLSNLALLNEAERHTILSDFNDTWTEFPRHLCVHQVFEQQVERAPDAVALIHEEQRLSYAELNTRANKLAHYLLSLGVGPDTMVGICIERSIETMISLLAILKAGGAYVPIDPYYPQERLSFIFEDTDLKVVLARKHLVDDSPSAPQHLLAAVMARGVQLVLLDDDWESIERQPAENMRTAVAPDNLAYVMYTSGSTGRPKGACITHLNITRLICNTDYIRLVPEDVIAQASNASFDAATFEIWGAFLTGARLVMLNKEVALSLTELADFLVQHRVTTLFLTTELFHQVIRQQPDAFNGLRHMGFGGDAVDARWVREALAAGGPERLLNCYGPTETTTFATWKLITEVGEDDETVPIGGPIANTTLYVLDQGMRVVPVGVKGELYVGGEGVCRGYLSRAELTAERFVPDPFSSRGGERLYRTGDEVRWNDRGEIEFIGRVDHQVKVRGFRIELGEVEAVLKQHEQVQDSVVVVREERGDKQLVGYVLREKGVELGGGELRSYLRERLPEYMVPSAFVVMEQWPLTPNDKVDRKALPAPEQQRPELEHSFVAPRTQTEELLAGIWGQVLRFEQVGINDNFFELGGDSILSIQIIARANQAGLQLSPRDLFLQPSVAALAQIADSRRGSESTVVVQSEQGVVTGSVPLTPVQHWFFEDQRLPQPQHFNQSVMLEVPAEIDPAPLLEALKKLVIHHDALRLRFTHTATGWQQQYAESESAEFFSFHDLSSIPASERVTTLEAEADRLQRSLNLTEGPLLRAALFRYSADEPQRLLLVIHHLVVDGVSWRILLEDLQRGYEQAARGEAIELSAKTSSFKQWAEQLKEYAQTAREQLSYWSAAASEGVASLPRDYTGGGNTIASTQSINLKLDQEQTRALLQEVPGVYHTQINDVLLTALGRVLGEWSGSERVVVELEGHGREEIGGGVDVTRTVGWFTTLYPVVLEIPPDAGIGAALKRVKEQLRAVPEKGIGYGVLRYMDQGEAQLQALQPEVSFNYLGQFGSGMSAEKGWRAARESAGEVVSREGKRAHLLEVEARVGAGRLWVEWNYSTEEHAEETIRRLGERYIEVLEELIEHCRSDEAGGYTPSDFPLAQVTQEQLEAIERNYPQLEQLYPLSPVQEGMLFHSLYAPESGAYIVQMGGRLRGAAELEKLIAAWQEVVARHEVLRASFIWEGVERAHQVVERGVKLDVQREDWRNETRAAQERKLDEYLRTERERSFDFRRGPLMRLAAIQLNEHEYHVCWTSHHLLFDGWSVPIIRKEVAILSNGKDVELDQPRPYRDYIAWLQSQDLSAAEAYWRRTLQGFSAPTPLSIDSSSHSELLKVDDYSQQRLKLSTELSSSLQRMSREKQVTLNTLVQGAWALLLSRYSGEREVLFGTTVSGRPAQLDGVEQMVGPLLNTLPVRINVAEDELVESWLKQVQAGHAEMRQYEHSPLVEVQGWSEMPRGVPLFESILVFENYPEDLNPRQTSGETTTDDETPLTESTNYPITIIVMPGQNIFLEVLYNNQRFDRAAIKRMLGHLEMLLTGMTDGTDQPLSSLSLLTDVERHTILYDFNDTSTDFRPLFVHQIIEQQVERTPDAVALVYEGQKLSYAELNTRANQLAHHLVSLGVGPDMLVGVCLERSIEMVVSLLAILKAGGAYVPLDPGYPPERLSYMSADAGVKVLLTHTDLRERIAAGRAHVLCLDALELAGESGTNPGVGVGPDNLAYVIYTSGSTGNPKGAMNTHDGLCNRLQWIQAAFTLTSADRVLQKTSYSFDVSVWEFFWPLMVGATLVVAKPGGHKDSRYLVEVIQAEAITTMHFVPSMLQVFLEERGATECKSLKRVICSGEALGYELQRRFFAVLGTSELHNLYGPTEASIDVTWWECRPESELGIVPIGLPIANTDLYIVDAAMQPVPVGIRGELLIGGVGLARGYLGRAELTAERFIPDGLSGKAGARLYRTGDVARYLEGGAIEYLGRSDHQVKVRGYRIELGEIEAVLSAHEAVRDCVVVAREEVVGEKRLIGYLVAETGVSQTELRAFLKERLPEYMVPALFIMLDQLPLTPNGKVDRKALPAPEQHRPELEYVFVAPRTATEELLAGIWSRVLRLEQVGVNDNFFELGGDSILSIQIIARANQAGLQLSPRDLFQHPSVADLAQVADAGRGSESTAVAEQGVVTGAVPLIPIQHWFFEQRLAQPHHFNQSVLLQVPSDLDPDLFAQVLAKLVLHHDALRLRFTHTAAGWQQYHAEAETAEFFSFHDLSAVAESERTQVLEAEAERLQRSLNLADGPLLRVALFRYSVTEAQRLLLVVHHLAVDGVSWRILLEDLQRAYAQAAGGERIDLGAKTSSFKQWAEQLQAYAQTAAVREQLTYWTRAGSEGVARLPRDYASGENTIASLRSVSMNMNREQTRALLQEVPGVYHTQINDVLLTALGRVLGEWSGAERVVVEFEGHGREEIGGGVDVTRTVGWFATLYPVEVEVRRDAGIGASLKRVKEQLRAVPEKGIGYGLLRYMDQSGAQLPELQPEVRFNYLGQFGQGKPAQNGWRAAPESSGENEGGDRDRKHLLDMDASVGGGQLRVEWSFSTAVHDEETIKRVSERYIEVLEELIEHCRSAEAGGYTPSDFPLARVTQEQLEVIERSYPQMEQLYALSPGQVGMLFHTLYSPDSGMYVLQYPYTLKNLDVPIFEQAWQQVVNRHSILRTAFTWSGLESPLQVVNRHIEVNITTYDWRELSRDEQERQLESYMQADRTKDFDLSKVPIMRWALFQVADDVYQFCWTTHHMLLDGWSLPVVFEEVITIYDALLKNERPQLEPSRPYSEYIAWLQRQNLAEAETFWRRKLQGFTSPTPLNFQNGAVSPNGDDKAQPTELIWVSKEKASALQAMARKYQMTLNTILQGAWAMLLSLHSETHDVVFGATVSGRPPTLPGVETMVGPFINTLPVRIRLEREQQLITWLKQLQEDQVETRQYEHSPLVEVQGWSEVPRGVPLFESHFVFENFKLEGLNHERETGLSAYSAGSEGSASFPLSLTVIKLQKLGLQIHFDQGRFSLAVVKRLLKTMETVLDVFLAHPNSSLGAIEELLAEANRQQRLAEDEALKEIRLQKFKNIKRKAVSESTL